MDDWYQYFWITDESLVFLNACYSNEKLYNIVEFDLKNNKEMNAFDPFTNNKNLLTGNTPFTCSENNRLFYTQPFDMNVYELTKDSLTALYRLEFNTEFQLPENYKGMDFFELKQDLRYKNVVIDLNGATMVKNTLYVLYSPFCTELGIRHHITALNTKSGAMTTVRFGDELYEQFPFAHIGPLMFHKDCFVSYASASDALALDKAFPSDKNADGKLHEMDNPVIFFHKLKHF